MDSDLIQFVALDRVPFALLVLALGWVVVAVSGRALDDLGERFANRRLFLKKVKAFSRFFLYFLIAAIVAGSVLDLRSEALLAGGLRAPCIGAAASLRLLECL